MPKVSNAAIAEAGFMIAWATFEEMVRTGAITKDRAKLMLSSAAGALDTQNSSEAAALLDRLIGRLPDPG